ncbi:MAG: leucine-rich repeat domain-containing protein [Leptolyngbya sp. BL-A-14]
MWGLFSSQLRALSLYRNQITDLSPLQSLTNLTEIEFGENPVSI